MPADDSHNSEIDKLVSQVSRPDSPGCSVAIARNGEIVYKRAQGMADLEHDVQLTTDSVFDIGSVSKEFTAASIILLAQAGKLKLSDSVRKFIPELPALYDPITIDHLIHHTAGVPDVLWLWALRHDGLGETHVSENEAEVHDGNGDFHYSVDDFLTLLGRVKALMFDPGDHFTYSNSNYILLSIVVQRASGKPLRDFAQENIFKPLGMSHTQFVDDHGLIVRNRAIGYLPKKGGGFFKDANVCGLIGDGGVYTTPEDLLRWDQNFDTGQVGGPEFLKLMLQPVKLRSGKEYGYGGGLYLRKYRGLDMVGHGGGSSAYLADFRRFPGQHLAVATLCNTRVNPAALDQKIADLYLGREFKEAAVADDSSRPSPVPKSVDASDLNLGEYAGDYYSDEIQTTYRFIVEGNELRLYGRKSNIPEARPIGNDQFFFPPGMDLHFVRDAQSHVSGFTLAIAFIPLRDEAYSVRPSVTFRRIHTGALPTTGLTAPSQNDISELVRERIISQVGRLLWDYFTAQSGAGSGD